MKRSLRILFAALLLTGAGIHAYAHETYYWVVGTGNWNTMSNWRVDTLGRALLPKADVTRLPLLSTVPAKGLPSSIDDVYFNYGVFVNQVRNGNTVTTPESKTVTISQAASARNMYWAGLTVVPFFDVNAPLTLSGSLFMNSPVFTRSLSTSTGRLTIASELVFNFTASTASMTIAGPISIGTNLTVNAPVPIVPNGGLSVGGSIRITSTGASLALNGATTVGGSFTLAAEGNLTGTAGSLTFTSTSTSTTIEARGATIGVPVIFNGVGGRWTLQSNLTVSHSANFVNGHVVALPLSVTNPLNPNGALPPTDPTTKVTGSPRFIFGVTATVSGAKHSSHVIGYVQKAVIKDTPEFEFPIGDGTYYRPMITDVAKSGNNLLARYLSVAPVRRTTAPNPEWSRIEYMAPLNSVSEREFWYFDAPDNSSPGLKINAAHPDPAIAQYMRLDRWFGLTVAGLSTSSSNPPLATWTDLNSRPTAPAYVANPVTMTTNAQTGATDFWVNAGGASNSNNWITFGRRGVTPMPVRLVSFTGQQLNGQAQLKWQSSSEENTSHFEVERSADGKHFSQVLTKKAQGNSASLVSYNAIDNSPLAGTSYYRLKMVDLDGTFEYSKLVAVSAEGTLLAKAYPNPSKGNGVSIIAGDGSKLVLKAVSDLFGKQVSYQAGSSSAEGVQINFTQPLPAGFYVATLAGSDNGLLVKVKFVVQ